MSFDINPSKNLSNIQASAKSCPGGGGNTGYFRRDKKKNDENEFHFKEDEIQTDTVTIESLENIEDDNKETGEEGLFSLIILFFKNLFNQIKRIFKK